MVRNDWKSDGWSKSRSFEHLLKSLIYVQVADLAITDLTITSDRAEAVDFTTPFMTLGTYYLFAFLYCIILSMPLLKYFKTQNLCSVFKLSYKKQYHKQKPFYIQSLRSINVPI